MIMKIAASIVIVVGIGAGIIWLGALSWRFMKGRTDPYPQSQITAGDIREEYSNEIEYLLEYAGNFTSRSDTDTLHDKHTETGVLGRHEILVAGITTGTDELGVKCERVSLASCGYATSGSLEPGQYSLDFGIGRTTTGEELEIALYREAVLDRKAGQTRLIEIIFDLGKLEKKTQ